MQEPSYGNSNKTESTRLTGGLIPIRTGASIFIIIGDTRTERERKKERKNERKREREREREYIHLRLRLLPHAVPGRLLSLLESLRVSHHSPHAG